MTSDVCYFFTIRFHQLFVTVIVETVAFALCLPGWFCALQAENMDP